MIWWVHIPAIAVSLLSNHWKTSWHLWSLHPRTKRCLKTVLCIEVANTERVFENKNSKAHVSVMSEKKTLHRLCLWAGWMTDWINLSGFRFYFVWACGVKLGWVPPQSPSDSCNWGSGGQEVRTWGDSQLCRVSPGRKQRLLDCGWGTVEVREAGHRPKVH